MWPECFRWEHSQYKGKTLEREETRQEITGTKAGESTHAWLRVGNHGEGPAAQGCYPEDGPRSQNRNRGGDPSLGLPARRPERAFRRR